MIADIYGYSNANPVTPALEDALHAAMQKCPVVEFGRKWMSFGNQREAANYVSPIGATILRYARKSEWVSLEYIANSEGFELHRVRCKASEFKKKGWATWRFIEPGKSQKTLWKFDVEKLEAA